MYINVKITGRKFILAEAKFTKSKSSSADII